MVIAHPEKYYSQALLYRVPRPTSLVHSPTNATGWAGERRDLLLRRPVDSTGGDGPSAGETTHDHHQQRS